MPSLAAEASAVANGAPTVDADAPPLEQGSASTRKFGDPPTQSATPVEFGRINPEAAAEPPTVTADSSNSTETPTASLIIGTTPSQRRDGSGYGPANLS